ncbi:hypothetical protein BH23BAC1_BH23BAC1_40520 [soil metagenome]
MVKNCTLWLIFGLLLTVTSATACFAVNPDEEIILHEECLIDNTNSCEHIIQEANQNSQPNPEKEKPSVNKETSPSILNSNFIFYIIFKYRFMEISGNSDKNFDAENEDQESSPFKNFSTRIINFVYSFFEDRF